MFKYASLRELSLSRKMYVSDTIVYMYTLLYLTEQSKTSILSEIK